MATTKTMKGSDVRALRDGLGLSRTQFGQLFGLGMSAVQRWEIVGKKQIGADPFARRIFECLVRETKRIGRTRMAKTLSKALAHEHPLFALWTVLGLGFAGGKTPRKAKGRSGRRSVKATAKSAAPRRATKRAKRGVVKTAKAAPTKAKATPRAKRAPKPKADAPAETAGTAGNGIEQQAAAAAG